MLGIALPKVLPRREGLGGGGQSEMRKELTLGRIVGAAQIANKNSVSVKKIPPGNNLLYQ